MHKPEGGDLFSLVQRSFSCLQKRPARPGRGGRGSGLVQRGREGGRRRAKKGCAVGAVGTLRRKMDSIFHEHRSKHGLREGREGGVGLRWKSNTAECHQPTSQTIGGRAPETMFHFVGCESRDKPHTHHSVSCVTPTWNKESSNSSGRWRRGTRTPCAFFAVRPPLFVN